MRIIQLLEQKNHFLEKLLSLNELQASLLRTGEIDTLDEFYERREKIMDTIQYIDGQLRQCYHDEENLSGEQVSQVKKLLFIKDEYVKRILEQEVMILSLMDEIKTQLLREWTETKEQRKALQGYHSQTRPSGKMSERY